MQGNTFLKMSKNCLEVPYNRSLKHKEEFWKIKLERYFGDHINYLLVHKKITSKLSSIKTRNYFIVSAGQLGSSLALWFWPGVSYEAAMKVSTWSVAICR